MHHQSAVNCAHSNAVTKGFQRLMRATATGRVARALTKVTRPSDHGLVSGNLLLYRTEDCWPSVTFLLKQKGGLSAS